jgi:hypothetical protein
MSFRNLNFPVVPPKRQHLPSPESPLRALIRTINPMSIRQLTTPITRRGSTSAPIVAGVVGSPTRTPSRPIPAANMHTSTSTSASASSSTMSSPVSGMSPPASHGMAGSSAPTAASSPPGSAAASSSASSALFKATASPAVETWWGNRPCPAALGTPTGVMFDGSARARGSERPRMRWDFEDHVGA